MLAGGKGLHAHINQLDAQLSAILAAIRSPLSSLHRATLEVLVIALVHARDIASTLVLFST